MRIIRNYRKILFVLITISLILAHQNCQKGFSVATLDGSSLASSTQGGGGPVDLTPGSKPELWYWHSSNLSSNTNNELQKTYDLIDKAVLAGYTGLVFADGYIGGGIVNAPANTQYVKQAIAYAVSKGLKVLPGVASMGWGTDYFVSDPNLAEGMRVIGSQFKVVNGSSGRELQFASSFLSLSNANFENDLSNWGGDFPSWVTGGQVTLDTSVAHSGSKSVKIVNTDSGFPNARVYRQVKVLPWRTYHLSLWYKSLGIAGNTPQIAVGDADNDKLSPRLSTKVTFFNPNADWTRLDYTFNSRESTSVFIYFGFWDWIKTGPQSGTMWVDDFDMEETALVNLLRRPGTPLKVYDPNNPSTVYSEGTDLNPIIDKGLPTRGNFNFYHTPSVVTLPSNSRLALGQLVAMDYYSVFPTEDTKVSVCLTEPGIFNFLTKHAQILDGLFPAASGFFMGHDEIRAMYSCALCKSKGNSPGAVLALNTSKSISILKGVRPNAPLYVWNDMFDPYHNAIANQYFIEGDVAGSWSGLSADITIMNWNQKNQKKSLNFFAGKESRYPIAHRQIIAGYYDAADGAAQAAKELANIQGIPGIQGFMYTTWDPNYSQLKAYADAVKAAWPTYLSSVKGQ